jgi:hypothetical protein
MDAWAGCGKPLPLAGPRLLKQACFVTFTQQLSSFSGQKGEKPKKAALAAVFGLPQPKATGLNSKLALLEREWGRI